MCRLRKVCAARIPTKLRYLPNACDVTCTKKCKQTSADLSVSSSTFVLNIYKQVNIQNFFFSNPNITELLKSCVVLFYSLKTCSFYHTRWHQSAFYLLVIGSSSSSSTSSSRNSSSRSTSSSNSSSSSSSTYGYPNISKYGIPGACVLILLDTRSNMTHKYGTNFFIVRLHYKWEDWNWYNSRQFRALSHDMLLTQVQIIWILNLHVREYESVRLYAFFSLYTMLAISIAAS